LLAASVFHYRNKLEYSFAPGAAGPVLGFHKAGRWDEVIDIAECWLTTELGNRIREAVRAWARESEHPAYDQEAGTGFLRHLVYREGRNTGQVLLQLVTAPGKLDAEGFVAALRRFPEVRSIHHAVNDRPAEVTNLPTTLLWGDEAIEEQMLGLRFRVRPTAFLQTNTEMAERLYELAIDAAALTGEETVWDLYCGTGTIGLSMASKALTVWGVDVSEESIACALENADLNGVANSAFFAGEVGQAVEELRDRSGDPDVVVVDPPRAGLSNKAIRRLGRIGAPRIVYVSCNPTTLAGNAKLLRNDWGYELKRTRPVDMFPHTPHVESVSLLER
jgi:23S rRNA (uracil1939-C5)-methyltransferase